MLIDYLHIVVDRMILSKQRCNPLSIENILTTILQQKERWKAEKVRNLTNNGNIAISQIVQSLSLIIEYEIQ